MIPKVIHYCWFGSSPLPTLALECIASWGKYLPGYEIKEWNESNFDVNIIPYTSEAYKAKKYAFVSDYARFWVLYQYGGIYFDTDVEVIRPMDDILTRGGFMGFEMDPYVKKKINGTVATGLGLGVNSGLGLIKDIINYYNTLVFTTDISNIQTVVDHTTNVLVNNGLKPVAGIQEVGGVFIYPSEYFAPINIISKRLHITDKTRTIHRYMDSWSDKKKKKTLWSRFRDFLPESLLIFMYRVRQK